MNESKLPLRSATVSWHRCGCTLQVAVNYRPATMRDSNAWKKVRCPIHGEELATVTCSTTEQPNSALPLFGLAPFMADIIRDELRECASDEWTPESLAEAIVSALREKAPEQADSRITRDQFSRIVGEMSTYDFVNGTLDVEAVFTSAGVEIVDK